MECLLTWGRGGLLRILGGSVLLPGSPNPDPISDFPYPFSKLAFRQKLCYHRFEHKQKNSSNLEMFIHSHSSLKTISDSRTKMGNMYTRFQTKRPPPPYFWTKLRPEGLKFFFKIRSSLSQGLDDHRPLLSEGLELPLYIVIYITI